MTRLTATQRNGLTNMNRKAQDGTLGTRVDALEYGGAAILSGVTLTGASTMMYETAPIIGTDVYILTAVTLGAATQTITTFAHQPDFPRVLTIKGSQATLATNVAITGTDFADATITDTIQLNDANSVSGTKAFKTVTSILFPIKTNGSGDTVSIGVADKIGFPIAIPYSYLFFEALFYGTHDAGSLSAAATVAGSYFTVAGTLNGTKKLDLYFASFR
jgi:hypothetical protein